MAISNESKVKIVDLFNGAIDSYNEVVSFRKISEKKSLIEEFNSNVQYYSAMEAAFRCVILEEMKKPSCPHNLHEMIEILVTELDENPLENGVDLFYILRYKDTRNQTVHNIDLCKMNAYPRLFLNGYMFIKKYIDSEIIVHSWDIESLPFDFSLFKQNFHASVLDNIKILVLPPMYSDMDKLHALFSYHWNMVLDFDPYSTTFGAYSQLDVPNKRLIQLSDIEAEDENAFNVDEITWIMCDGDALMNVDSFRPKKDFKAGVTLTPQFIPSMYEGNENVTWPKRYNLNKTQKYVKQLLNELFSKYLSKMNYDIDVLFVMDYSRTVYECILNALEDSMTNSIINRINVHILNSSLSNDLEEELDSKESWYSYNSTIDSFVEKIINNIGGREQTEDVKLLPCNAPCDGKIPLPTYNHISKEFFVLHTNFPTIEDEISESLSSTVAGDAEHFLRGEKASWRLIKSRLILDLDIKNTLKSKIEKSLNDGKRYFYFFHAAGYGGSTLAKQVAFDLKHKYPVLFMKKYDKDNLANRINSIYGITHEKILVFAEEEVFDSFNSQHVECLKIAESTNVPILFVFISRRPHSTVVPQRDGLMLKSYIPEDIERIVEMNKNIVSIDERQQKIVNSSGEDFIRELGEDNICPFLINLSIYKGEFVKINKYLEPFICELKDRQDTLRVFVYTAIFTAFINRGVHKKMFCNKLNISEDSGWNSMLKKYDPIIYARPNLEYSIWEVVIRAPFMAETLLKLLLGDGNEGVLYQQTLNKYLKELIYDIKGYYNNTDYANSCIQQLFIEKGHQPNVDDEYSNSIFDKDIRSIKKYFAPIIEKLWDKDNISLAGEIFETLIEKYPSNPYYYAHAARYYSYTGRNYEKGHEYIKKAVKLVCEDKCNLSVKADIYHVKGMCIREELFKKLEFFATQEIDLIQGTTINSLRSYFYESAEAFETTLKYASYVDTRTTEYAYTAWLTLILRTVVETKLSLFNDKEIEKEVMIGLSIIDDLEDLYVQRDEEDSPSLVDKLEDIYRKKESFYASQKEYSDAISSWNNYYDEQKKKGKYDSCYYSCKQKYFLLQKQTKGFIHINEKNLKNIEKLADECYESLLHMDYSTIRFSDIKVFMEISKVANYRVNNPMSLINEIYQQNRSDNILLYYRYVLSFIKAYGGDKLALKDCVAYLKECKNASEKLPGKINIIDYFVENSQMGQLYSRRRLVALDEQYRTQAYNAENLLYMTGIIKQQGNETYILPYDKNNELMTGIEVHVNLKHNHLVESRYSGYPVHFKFGFSYDGLKAENVSVKPITEVKDSFQEKKIEKGDYTEFIFKKTHINRNSGKTLGLIGTVEDGENCMIHIKNISNAFVSEDNMKALVSYCSKNIIKVQLINKTEKGWEGSLKSQKVNFENIKL